MTTLVIRCRPVYFELVRPFVLPLLALLSALTPAASARAFCVLTSVEPEEECECSDKGVPLFWSTPNLEYALHEEGFAGIPDRDLRNVLQQSFDTWVDVECQGMPTGISFEQRGETTSRLVEHDRHGSNLNVVSLLSPSEWLEIEPKKPTAYAVTSVWHVVRTGEIFGADIHFNQGLGPFVLCPDEGCAPGTVDFRAVATHEAGHFLGLGHSAELGSTMWCAATPGELEKRSLEDDDRAGLCAIYGDGSAWDPSRVDQPLSSRRGRRGCSVVMARDESQAATTWLGALLAIAYARRARQARKRSA